MGFNLGLISLNLDIPSIRFRLYWLSLSHSHSLILNFDRCLLLVLILGLFLGLFLRLLRLLA
jgi:hypothetical protein